MDKAMLISIIILVIIAAVEIICLFFCSRLRMKKVPVAAVLPIYPNDDELEGKLEYIGEILFRNPCNIDCVFLIDYGASDAQLELCCDFCRTHTEADIISPDEIEKILSETFAITKKT